jgi:hypothetical protein
MPGKHLYLIQSGTGSFKIGRSDNPKKRLSQLQTGNPEPLKLILILENKGGLELSLHRKLAHGKTKGGEEWFSYDMLPELPSWIYEQLDLDFVNFWWTPTGIPKPGLASNPDG